MKQISCDVLIIGAGLIGLVAAYSLSILGYKIIIVEQKKILNQKQPNTKNDTRTTAIAEGSKNFLKKINLWKNLSIYAEPIKNINVIDRSPKAKIEFYNNSRDKNLGYIVKNSDITKVLVKFLLKKKNVVFFDGKKINTIENLIDNPKVFFDNLAITSDLIIAADGKRSSVRNILKTPVYKKSYTEKALVINFTHSQNHNNQAYEFFYESGPLAILPMQKIDNKFQSSLIWSNNSDYLEGLVKSKEEFIINILNNKIYNSVGKIEKLLSKQIFSLSAHINARFYEKKIIYVGDSAHSVHPIAGQGWNLGLRDVKNLYDLSKETKNLGLKIGTDQFCIHYNEKCYYDSFRLYQITDKLNTLFKLDSFIINNFRFSGLGIIQKSKSLKKYISNFAMGL